MAQSVVIGNKLAKLPGAYATLLAGGAQEAALASYNNILLIDAGAGNGFNSIKGIGTGANTHGKGAIYALTEEEANYFVKGGPLAPVINALYHPAQNKPGIGTLFLLKAATTTPAATDVKSVLNASVTYTSMTTVEEGVIVNTTKVNSVLKKGYLAKAVYNKTLGKGWIEVWQGTYQGTNLSGAEVGITSQADSTPVLVYKSKRCKTPGELVDFLNNSSEFKALFTVVGLTAAKATFWGDGETETDLNTEITFSGGTETYLNSLAEVLPYTIDVDYSAMMICDATQDTQSFVNVALDHIVNDAKGIKQIVTWKIDKEDAIYQARALDNDAAIVVCGQSKKVNAASDTGFVTEDAMVLAAKITGRIFGLSPEIPGTLKNVDVDGMVTEFSDADLEDFLDSGVVTSYYDSDLTNFVITQAVNSLQRNSELINAEDCSTYSVQAKRILAIVFKNLVVQSKKDFWGNDDVPTNAATLSNAYVKAWTETLLGRMTYASSKTTDNYLLEYGVTKIETYKDAKRVYLWVRLNSEITKILFFVTVLG